MARFIQREGTKGSKKWIQKLINEKHQLLDSQIREKLNIPDEEKIKWFSPLKNDEYAEYRDEAFLELLGAKLETLPLESFWPKGGPQWDALGKSSSGKLFLVEAKSHIPELFSTLRAKSKSSENKILESLAETKMALGSKTDFDWSKGFYQYANRLALLHLLKMNKLSAFFVNVYFVNDAEMNGPSTADEWKGAIRLFHRCLGLREHLLQKFVTNIFIDVANLK